MEGLISRQFRAAALALILAAGAQAAPRLPNAGFPDHGPITPPERYRASSSKPLADTGDGSWKVLVLIYPGTDADYLDYEGAPHHFTGTLAPYQAQLLQSAAASSETLAEQWSGGMAAVEMDVVTVDRAISTVSQCCGSDYWIEPDDAGTELIQYFAQKPYDSVVVLWYAGDIPTWSYWGLAFVGDIEWQGRRFTWAAVHYGNDSGWQGPYPGEVIVHEWLHGLEGFYRNNGFRVADLHGAIDRGFTTDDDGSWNQWYSALMQGTAFESCALTGISKSAWMYGSVNSRTTPISPQLLWPPSPTSFNALPELQWKSGPADSYTVSLYRGPTLVTTVPAGNGRLQTDTAMLPLPGHYEWTVKSQTDGVVSSEGERLGFDFGPHACAGEVTKASVTSLGAGVTGTNGEASVSRAGRLTAFVTASHELAPNPGTTPGGIVIYDRLSRATSRVDLPVTGTSQPPGASASASISHDGRYVAFSSDATNLVAGDTNTKRDCFVADTTTGQIERVSLSSSSKQISGHACWSPQISGDGKIAAFLTTAPISSDDQNSKQDVYLRHPTWQYTQLISVNTSGDAGNGDSGAGGLAISAEGGVVAFASLASDLVSGDTNDCQDVFANPNGGVELISAGIDGAPANGASGSPSVSGDGRYIAFESVASNLVPDDTNGCSDVFIRDRVLGSTTRVSVSTRGQQANEASTHPSISADGMMVAFQSLANNLDTADTDSAADIFVRDLRLQKTALASVHPLVPPDSLPSVQASLSPDAMYVGFASSSGALTVCPDTSPADDVFLREVCSALRPSEVVVTNTSDSGPGSLRAAIELANSSGNKDVRFEIPASDPGHSGSVFVIKPATALPEICASGVTIDGSSQVGFDGTQDPGYPVVVLSGQDAMDGNGLVIRGSHCTVKGLTIQSFPERGLFILGEQARHNTVEHCFLGTTPNGTAAAANGYCGVEINWGSSGNLIRDNLVSGNTGDGMRIYGTGTRANTIQGNRVGVDLQGAYAIANGENGIELDWDTDDNIIGGAGTAARNIVSGNIGIGISIYGTGTHGNIVRGNYIGVNAAGDAAVPNHALGMELNWDTTGNIIGGTSPYESNVISGNLLSGIGLYGDNVTFNYVIGNLIGTGSNGTGAIPNGQTGVSIAWGAHGNFVGGSSPGEGNIIANNAANGVDIYQSNSNGNRVIGNRIGCDAAGAPGPNGGHGIQIAAGASGTIIGGEDAASRNLIHFNLQDGIRIYDNCSGNSVLGNSICWNSRLGINLEGGSQNAYSVTTNDALDADNGPNGLQNWPVMTSASSGQTGPTLQATLQSKPNTTYVFRFYSGPADGSGYSEGFAYLGSQTATTNASGSATASLVLHNQLSKVLKVVATATDPSGSTSEFGSAVALGGSGGFGMLNATARDLGRTLARSMSGMLMFRVTGRLVSTGDGPAIDDGSIDASGQPELVRIICTQSLPPTGSFISAAGILQPCEDALVLVCSGGDVVKVD